MCVNYSIYLHVATYMFIAIEQNTNFKQNIQKNRLKIKELLERKIGEKKSKIGSSLFTQQFFLAIPPVSLLDYLSREHDTCNWLHLFKMLN